MRHVHRIGWPVHAPRRVATWHRPGLARRGASRHLQRRDQLTTHIAIDLDGVLLDFTGGICNAVRTEYGVDLRPEDIKEWDLHPQLDPIIGRSWWAWLRERDWLWPNFPAVNGAIGAVDQLRRDGHYLEIVTAKPEWAAFTVWKWMGKWRPNVHQVTVVEVGEPKHFATDAEVLIDDHLDNCRPFVDSDPQRSSLLFTQPYNYSLPTGGGVVRVNGWQDMLRAIKELY